MENAKHIVKVPMPLPFCKASIVGAPTTSRQNRSAHTTAINHAQASQTNGADPLMPAYMDTTSLAQVSLQVPLLDLVPRRPAGLRLR